MPTIPIKSPRTSAAASPPSKADTGVNKPRRKTRKKQVLKIHRFSILLDFDHVILGHMNKS